MSETARIINFLKKDIEIDFSKTREVAIRFKELSEIKNLLEQQIDQLKPVLIEARVSEYFPEEGKKVVYSEGRSLTEINTEGLFDMLFKAGRMWDFVRVASVTATNLKKLSDGEVLEAKFKSVKGSAADSVSLTDMTKADRLKIG